MSQYAVNTRSGKLHTVGCRCVKDTFNYTVSHDVSKLLTLVPSKASGCKICLKADEKAQELVRKHNSGSK
jgi:hypothetical protein